MRLLDPFRRLPPLGDKPVVVLSATGSDALGSARRGARAPIMGQAGRASLFETLAQVAAAVAARSAAQLSTNSAHIITSESGHQIPLTQPDLVVAAIQRVVAQARDAADRSERERLRDELIPASGALESSADLPSVCRVRRLFRAAAHTPTTSSEVV